ncbi:hypothetical protein JCGZ_22434 [Jatropha curcas]|uniref:Uncharacterized protein n=1 Tax=Jatropha curcas TaxID=180498 RepID=A0A067JQX0_JATCU|nr:hypothetical protein JCGZ_22434 [Jatropha curcas]
MWGGLYRHSMLCKQLKTSSWVGEDVATTDQLARVSFLLVLGCTVAHDWADHVDLGLVQSLVNLGLLGDMIKVEPLWHPCTMT